MGAGFCSFMHGAQDGQKFLSVACLAIALSQNRMDVTGVEYPLWLMVGYAAILAVGVGG